MERIKNIAIVVALIVSVTTSLLAFNNFMSDRHILNHETKKVIKDVEILKKENHVVREDLASIKAKLDILLERVK